MDHSELDDLVQRAHRHRESRRFAAAYESFVQAAEIGELSADDVVAWGDVAWWLGRADMTLELAEKGHEMLLEAGERVRAAKEAIALGYLLMLRGELAAGSGWIQRGRSLLEEASDEPSFGYVVQLDAERALDERDLAEAVELARRANRAALAGGDTTLQSMALMTEGRALLESGEVTEAMSKLDQAMLPVRAGRVAPETAGNLYCQMIEICWDLVDLRRAREWTAATERWCEEFDKSVMFSGICRMHRVQLLQVAGEWEEAAAEAEIVCTELAGMNVSVVAEGHYLLGELHRMRGDRKRAEEAFARAHEHGRRPEPGLSLLRAETGDLETAVASLRQTLEAWAGPAYGRGFLLDALVETASAAGDVGTARAAADELADLADTWKSDGLRAMARLARGRVELAAGSPEASVQPLNEAIATWRDLDARHSCAIARLVLADAFERLGDQRAADMEKASALALLQRLGVAQQTELPGGLTPREAEVLLAVAGGDTNRAVAESLFISESTVARHLANIYLKIGVTTRTAAADWARKVGLGPPA